MKTNPKKIPRTEADVRRAYDQGVKAGVSNAYAIFLTVMLDKFNAEDQIQDIWNEICDLSEELGEHRVSFPDLKRVLLEEYGIHI